MGNVQWTALGLILEHPDQMGVNDDNYFFLDKVYLKNGTFNGYWAFGLKSKVREILGVV